MLLLFQYCTSHNLINNQQFNVKAILQKKKKDSNLCQTYIHIRTYIHIAITFKLKRISLFWYIDNFLDNSLENWFTFEK